MSHSNNEIDLHVAKSLAANERRLDLSNSAAGRFFTGGKNPSTNEYFPETTFRFTTEDEHIANEMAKIFGVDEIASIIYERGSNAIHEIRTGVDQINIVLTGEASVLTSLVCRKKGRVNYISDGINIVWSRNSALFNRKEIVPDPQAGMSLGDRKSLFRDKGVGAAPETDLYFRFASGPQRHLFRFSSRNWMLYKELSNEKLRAKLKQGDVHATLRIVKNAAYTRVALSVNS